MCVSRGLCLEEETGVCTRRPSGQCGHSCVGYQSDSQKQNDVAALHICRVGSIHIYKHLTCTCFYQGISYIPQPKHSGLYSEMSYLKTTGFQSCIPLCVHVSLNVPFPPETSMATCCGAERDIFPAPCHKQSPAVSPWTSADSHWTIRLLLCPLDPGTPLISCLENISLN